MDDLGAQQIVTNRLDEARPLGWRVAERPSLEIGGTGADALHTLFEVRDAARLSDGRIAILGAGDRQVRIYTPDGAHVRSLGGEGEGPGEFRLPTALSVGRGDSLYVFDSELQRLTLFDGAGELVGTRALHVPDLQLSVVRRLAGGRFYGLEAGGLQPGGAAGSLRTSRVRFVFLTDQLAEEGTIATVPGPITATFGAPNGLAYRFAPFSPVPVHHAGMCFHFAAGTSFDVWSFSSEGRLVRRVRNLARRSPVTDTAAEAWLSGIVESLPSEARPRMREILQDVPMPDSLPTYSGLVVDPTGHIWLQPFTPPDGPGRVWWVLEPDGRLAGTLRTPVPLRLFEIGPDFVLGLWRGELGEEVVRLYALSRPTVARQPRSDCE